MELTRPPEIIPASPAAPAVMGPIESGRPRFSGVPTDPSPLNLGPSMYQEFVYPPHLARTAAESGAAMARYAVWFAAGWWIAGLGFLFLRDPPTWAGLPIAALMTAGALFFRRAHQRLVGRFADFEGQRLVADGDWVRQLDAQGAELGRIHLRESFQVRHGAVLHGNAILEVTQPGDAASFGAPRRIEFATCLQGGERLVREVFRSHRWPKSRW